jgi:NADPH-dependent 2,4-dienoyl-CoA reductase/sulfur reductase-like enzyme
MPAERIVVVGGGMAGLRAAERLRERGFGGTITVVGEERHRPYNRPPLSKQVLTGRIRPKDLHFSVADELNIQWRLNTRCIAVDPAGHLLHLPGREEMRYDGLVLATGVEPRHLNGTPLHLPHVWPIRTLDDSVGVNRALERARSVAIVGGGFIGCEAAAILRDRGLDVTLIDGGDVLLRKALGVTVGRFVTDLHEHAGVNLRLGVRVVGWTEHADDVTVQLDDGLSVRADTVIMAMGTVPCVEYLRGLSLDLTDGVLCDEYCFVVGLPDDVVAAGDCARWPNPRFGGPARRVEHWINAVEQARQAADNLLAGRSGAVPFRPIPRFWTDQYGLRIQGVGMPYLGTRIEIRTGFFNAKRRMCATFIRDGRLVGAAGINAPAQMIHYSHVLEQQGLVELPRFSGRPPAHLSQDSVARFPGPRAQPASRRRNHPVDHPPRSPT